MPMPNNPKQIATINKVISNVSIISIKFVPAKINFYVHLIRTLAYKKSEKVGKSVNIN